MTDIDEILQRLSVLEVRLNELESRTDDDYEELSLRVGELEADTGEVE